MNMNSISNHPIKMVTPSLGMTRPAQSGSNAFRAVIAILLVACFGAVSAVAAEQSGISYSRDFLKAEQKYAQDLLSDIQRTLENASRLRDAGVPGAADQLVRALFLSDLVSIRLEGQADRISQLKSSFGYVRTDEQRKYTSAYTGLRRELQTGELSALAMCKQFNAGTNGPTILQIFQTKQGDYRNLIRAGLTDVKTVLDDCSRQLAQVKAGPPMEPKSPDAGKTAVEVARLTREQGELQTQLTALRHAQEMERRKPAVQPPVTLIVTNEIVRTIEKSIPAPAPIVITNTERIFITNFVAVTNNPATASATTSNIAERLTANIAAIGAGIRSNNIVQESPKTESKAIAASKSLNTNAYKILTTGRGFLPWLGLIAIFAVIAGAYSLLTAARSGTFQLALNGKVLEPIEIMNSEDAIVLADQPAVQPHDDVADKARLSPTWRGTILRPGQDRVTVNDTVVTSACRIQRGDSIAIQDGEILRKFDFLGWDRNSVLAEA
jgi:hypothetical protein